MARPYILSKELKFNIIAPFTPIHFPDDLTSRPFTFDIAITEGVSLFVNCIESLCCLDSDHRPVLLKMELSASGFPKPIVISCFFGLFYGSPTPQHAHNLRIQPLRSTAGTPLSRDVGA
ncbi:hypothetical protein EVAR_65118_1 [Eumeta japonica]|uniref:Uncharacterized protein n=1 Tax=Eumeta variegata TaxID=151549 RepID=A0A4C1Z823_EUMVA|nr:hypothetical protein EVAR_65118_1 [Eumeta japonica]